MDSKAESYSVVYEDIEPFFEWHTDDDFHVLLVMLPGFRRDQLKVQVTSTPILKISAQRQIGGNRWRRVYKEFSLPSDCDPNDITAMFEAGTLKIKFQKLIITPSSKSPEREGDAAEKNDGPRLEDQTKPKKSEDQDQVYDKSQKVQESTAARDDDLTEGKGKGKTDYGVGKEKAVHQEKAKSSGDEDSGKTSQKEKGPEAAAASDVFSKEKEEINNGVHKKKAVPQQDQEKTKSSADEVSGEKPEAKQKEKEPSAAVAEAGEGKQRTKNVSRLKTRLLDFTLSLRRPSSRADQQEDYSSYDFKEPIGDLVGRLKKMKNLIKIMVGALLVVALMLYLKNIIFKASPLEGSEAQEL